MQTPEQPPDYSTREYAVPFGRYEGVRPNEYPANEVLVGRERQRARMMDWLLAMGSKGAYLVTGYRGVGKSSFVQFCVREYEDDVYGRYLHSRVGRRLLWDRVIAALALPFSFVLPLCAAHIVAGQLASSPFPPGPISTWNLTSESPLRLAILALLVFAVFQPLLHAAVLVSRAWYRARDQTRAALCALFLMVSLVALSVSAATAAAYACALLAVGNLISRAWSVLRREAAPGEFGIDPSSAPLGNDEESRKLRKQTMSMLGPACLLLTAFVVVPVRLVPRAVAVDLGPYVPPAATLAVALACLGFGFVIRSGDAQRIQNHFLASRPKEAAKATAWSNWWAGCAFILAALTILSASSWYAYPLVSDTLRWKCAIFVAVVGAIVVTPLLVSVVKRRKHEPSDESKHVWFHFQPYPRFVLAIRAAYTLVVGIEMLVLAFVAPTPSGPSVPNGGLSDWIHMPFQGWPDECLWVLLSSTFGIILLYFEQDWIASRHERNRRDDAYDVVRYHPQPNQNDSTTRMQQIHGAREFAYSTLFWSLFRVWLPTITVRVNLGFDNLSHSHVVKAMLMGLRDQYHRVYIAFRSPLAIGRRASRFVAAMLIAVGLGNRTSHLLGEILPQWAKRIFAASISIPFQSPSGAVSELRITSCEVILFFVILLLFRLVRSRGGFSHHRSTYSRLNRLLDALTASVRVTRAQGGGNATVGGRGGTASVQTPSETLQTDTPPQDPREIEQAFLELLHDIQQPFFGLRLAGQQVSLPAPQITFVFDELDKIGVPSPPVGLSPGQWPANYRLERERSRQMHRLFADMKNLLSTAPARFIFVGGRELHDEWLADRTSRQPLLSNVFDAEIYLPTLLVDSIVASPTNQESAGTLAPPREGEESTTADGNRNPKGCVYAYLNAQLARANQLSRLWHHKRGWAYGIFGGARSESEHFFVQEPDATGLRVGSTTDDYRPQLWRLYRTDLTKKELEAGDAEPLRAPVDWAATFFDQFALYLGFRSRGNPKRLNALIERFVRPTGRVVTDPRLRWSKFDCQHVLRFGHVQRSTIQLIATIQRRLDRIVGPRIDYQDDKIIRSALYLADYLLKFHRRAFSWANLERIDELLHVHRAPDLRRVLSEILAEWSECFLNPIFEGMYDFRFRSEIAAEVRYVSRRSDAEMAAFNFTLDESQALKTEYQTRLQNLGNKDEPTSEIHAALGELHDFDEEYEDARRHYLAAVTDLDAQSARVNSRSPLAAIAVQMFEDRSKPLRRNVDWGISRLRLMLQIGMTYERSRNYERAFVQYRDARTWATAMMFSLLDDYASDGTGERQEIRGKNRLETLKHLPLLFEPLFACAWAAEKAPTAIDASLSMVEVAIWDLRCRLPFVRLTTAGGADIVKSAPAAFFHANFAMVIAALHHSAGNLYFFKGCQAEEWLNQKVTDPERRRPGPRRDERPNWDTDQSVDGYMLQAQYHYVCALHDLRRFSRYRISTAKAKFMPEGAISMGGVAPLPVDLWPEFVLRRTAATLFCLADVWLGRISLKGLLAEDDEPSEIVDILGFEEFVSWLAGADLGTAVEVKEWSCLLGREADEVVLPRPPSREGGTMAPIQRLIKFDTKAGEVEWKKVVRYLRLSAWGKHLLVLGGHYEEAAREQLWAAANIENLLWAVRAQVVCDESTARKSLAEASCLILYALQNAKKALEEAQDLLAKARGNRSAPTVPTFARRIACSLGLLAARLGGESLDAELEKVGRRLNDLSGSGRRQELREASELRRKLEKLKEASQLAPTFKSLANQLVPTQEENERASKAKDGNAVGLPSDPPRPLVEFFRETLEQMMERSAYSMLNHLNALRILIVDSATRVLENGTIEQEDVVDAHMAELSRLDGEYASPLHFTPFHYGTAAVLWGKSLKKTGRPKKTLACIEKLLADGRRALTKSQQMYSSRQAYYEAISELYYLDDDFNDRFIHVHHALQMMGADLARELLSDSKET